MTLKWSAQVPKKPGFYWTRPKVLSGGIVPCVREVWRDENLGMMVRTEPGSSVFSMSLAFWASNHAIWFAGPLDGPPEV